MAKKQVVHKMANRTSKKGSFGPVSAINTAPVSVGNSVRGASPSVTQTSDGLGLLALTSLLLWLLRQQQSQAGK